MLIKRVKKYFSVRKHCRYLVYCWNSKQGYHFFSKFFNKVIDIIEKLSWELWFYISKYTSMVWLKRELFAKIISYCDNVNILCWSNFYFLLIIVIENRNIIFFLFKIFSKKFIHNISKLFSVVAGYLFLNTLLWSG
jgi:hypothetical protein